MSQDNFDKRIKKQLEGRSITPSTEAWNKLEDKLNNQKRNPKPLYWYVGLAASIVLGVFFIFNKTTNNQLVIQDDKVTQIDTISVKPKQESVMPLKVVTSSKTVDLVKKRVAKTEGAKPVINTRLKKEKYKAIQLNDIKSLKRNENNEQIVLAKKIEINPIVKTKKELSESKMSEVDLLLDEAKQELAIQEINKEKAEALSKQLLSEVEENIEFTFRQKILKTVKQNFKKVKVAVAQRNN